jgi:undecaprenyl-diphosphatase
MKTVSDIGAIGGVFVIGFVCTYLFLHKKINILVGLLICSLGATLFTVFLKILTARNRPELVNRLVVESGFSFPSGHATTAFIAFLVAAIIIYFNPKIPKLFKILCVLILSIFPFIVAFSRLYLGVHYFSDVVAGAMVGLTATCVFYYLMSQGKYD